MDVAIRNMGMICAMGADVSAVKATLFYGQPPAMSFRTVVDGRRLPVFEVRELPPLPDAYRLYDCRNNRLAYACFEQIAHTVDEVLETTNPNRLGVVLGSSTSGLAASEAAYQLMRAEGHYPENYHFHSQHAMGSLARFIAELAGARGPTYTVSTACSSSAKAMLSARGLIEADICDVVISGGVDSLCDLTVNGFGALGQLSSSRMNPLSQNRSGLNIGEGGALFVLTRDAADVFLWGGGESMDAFHMSAPSPDGSGAALAMSRALEDAQVEAAQVAYVNLHGTATRANDSMECQAVVAVVPDAYVASSKPFVGHCLGAAGAIEAGLCCISLADDACRLPHHVFDGQVDSALPNLKIAFPGTAVPSVRSGEMCYLSNSFAFGGNNCTMVFGRARGDNQNRWRSDHSDAVFGSSQGSV
ncbi:MAG: beta-ketoacyl-ACP synthase [Deltaproteobacteria bacterium]|nr:beta-ketoacyl-ACP synthase [Deltaproteobacteria bacterium]